MSSIQRRLKRGTLKGIWNSTFRRVDNYKRSRNGAWMLCDPFQDRFMQTGPGLTGHEMAALENKVASY